MSLLIFFDLFYRTQYKYDFCQISQVRLWDFFKGEGWQKKHGKWTVLNFTTVTVLKPDSDNLYVIVSGNCQHFFSNEGINTQNVSAEEERRLWS